MKQHQRYVTVRFHEIALKGRNRPFFIATLVNNVRRATQGMGVQRVWKGPMMVELELAPEAEWDVLRERLAKVCGVVKFALAYKLQPSLEKIEQLLAQVIPEHNARSFRISARRADKQFPLTSPEINRRLGSFVQERTEASVDLGHPELNIHVEILPREALVYFEEVPGPGGLPVGTGGKVVCLMSGGIDSPVAAYRMIKRGCRAVLAHYHAFPLVEGRSREKALELAQLLTQYQYDSRLYLVPFADLQKRVILDVPGPYRVVAYRRFMARIAQSIAQRERASALVTGECLGQVSSQTLENIATIDAAVTLPILRPLVGMDKQEITDQARALDTYDISIQPDEDCCSLFVPKHPATHTTVKQMEDLESALDIPALVQATVEQAEVREFSW